MEKAKAIIILVIASIIVAVAAGIALTQIAGAQTIRNLPTQNPQGTASNVYGPYPQQGSYPYGQQFASPYGSRMGICGRLW